VKFSWRHAELHDQSLGGIRMAALRRVCRIFGVLALFDLFSNEEIKQR